MDAAALLALLPPLPGRLAVVLCDGEAPSPDLLAACLARAALFYCADRAGWPYADLPRPPDLVVGDFDTLGPPPAGTSIPHEHDPDQDTTDAEKAVARAAAAGGDRVLLLGADGGHRDHALANLALPERFADTCDVVLVNDRGVTLRAAPGRTLSLDLPVGAVVSLNPMGRVEDVTLQGVRWPLAGAHLDWGGPTAVSNRVTAPPLRLRCGGGALLLTLRAGDPGMTLALVYGAFLIFAVVRLFRAPARDATDYIVAGRRLTLPAFVATTVSSWYGGILGVGEYAWTYGVSNWLVFGVPYYLYAVFFALTLARRARRSAVLTLPERLEARFGRGPAMLGAAVLFVMTVPAAYVLMLGVLVGLVTGWPLWAGVVLGTLLSTGYVFRGGLRAVVGTDRVQFVLMFLGFLVLVPACMLKWGGWEWLRASLPADHLSWDGGAGFQAVAVWYVIAAATLVEPSFYQRCYAARTERTARAGLLISVAFWIVFDFLTTTAGLYARAVLPDLAEPIAAFPRLADATLPPLLRGLFTVGLLATIMSTVDSYAFLAAVTGGRDLWGRWRRHDSESLTAVRWALAATAVFSVVLALWAGSVVKLWHHLGSLGTPALLGPVLLAHTSGRCGGRRVAVSMLTGAGVAGIWLLLGRGGPWLGVESIFPGLAASLAVLLPGVRRAASPSQHPAN